MVTDPVEVSWETKIKAFLHDPPDKSLCISGHINRGEEILRAINISGRNDYVAKADRWASSIQRISWKYDGKEPLIDFCGKKYEKVEYIGQPVLIHTLSGKEKSYGILNKDHLNDILNLEKDTIRTLTDKYDIKKKYFRIWRYFKDEIRKNIEENISKDVADEFVNLPADTRIPDHTIWDHLDVTSAIYGAMERGKPSLLMFKISPVQSFIINSRKEEDLWAGSHILSYLTYHGIKAIIERYGPDAFVYPYLRGLPLVDCDYFGNRNDSLRLATIPNKFLAIVSIEDASMLKKGICDRINSSWNELAEHVEKYVNGTEEFWNQIKGQWRITIEAMEFPDDPSGFIEDNRDNIPSELYDKYDSFMKNLKEISNYHLTPIDDYGLIFELLQSVVDYKSKHTKNHIITPPKDKCTMCGGKVAVADGDHASKLRKGEELCGVCLIKRYYRDFIEKKFSILIDTKSVSEVAMRKGDYLEEVAKMDEYKQVFNNFKEFKEIADIGWDVEYIYRIYDNKIKNIISDIDDNLPAKLNFHKDYFNNLIESMKRLRKKMKETCGAPPSYYGILMMDGDDMGMKLIGDGLKDFKEYLHPEVKIPEDDAHRGVFDEKRRLTPTIHTAISRSLMEFALTDIVEIVEKHRGELIYTGGDDVLALLPTDEILNCAYEIEQSFNRDFDGWRQYPNGTMSAGIIVVKYNYPLYDALKRVRSLEKKAKDQGKKRFCIGYLKGSQMYETGAKWDILKSDSSDGFLLEFINHILNDEISPKFIYDFMRMSENLKGLEEDAFKSLLKVELDRHSKKEFKGQMEDRKGKRWIDEMAQEILSLKSHTDGTYSSVATFMKILFEMVRDGQ